MRLSVPAALLAIALGTSLDAATSSRTAPATAPAVERTYPSMLPLTLEVSGDDAHELGSLRDFTITVQREGDYSPTIVLGPVNPFSSDNLCTDPMPHGVTGCRVNEDATVGTLRVDWRVPAAGTYRVVLSGKRRPGGRVETIGAFDLEARD